MSMEQFFYFGSDFLFHRIPTMLQLTALKKRAEESGINISKNSGACLLASKVTSDAGAAELFKAASQKYQQTESTTDRSHRRKLRLAAMRTRHTAQRMARESEHRTLLAQA